MEGSSEHIQHELKTCAWDVTTIATHCLAVYIVLSCLVQRVCTRMQAHVFLLLRNQATYTLRALCPYVYRHMLARLHPPAAATATSLTASSSPVSQLRPRCTVPKDPLPMDSPFFHLCEVEKKSQNMCV